MKFNMKVCKVSDIFMKLFQNKKIDISNLQFFFVSHNVKYGIRWARTKYDRMKGHVDKNLTFFFFY